MIMKKVLISSFDMEVGGVERSLISMLENFDYENNEVDLNLYSHTGDFFPLLPKKHRLLDENKKLATFRKPISHVFKEGNIILGIMRVLAIFLSKIIAKKDKLPGSSIVQMQLMWSLSIPFLPKMKKKYDVAISYLWPHYYVAEKINAKKKIAWIHTDYSVLETDIDMDLKIWDKYDHIIAVSEECKNAFLNKYPSLKNKVLVIENITSSEFIKKLADEEVVEKDIIEDKSFKVVTVARLSYAKGIDRAVEALNILHNRGLKDIKWYVVGDGGHDNIINDTINKYKLNNHFNLVGMKMNPYPYMKMADIYVQPSRYEGKAVTVSEAKVVGKPIVITNYATAKSQIKDNIDGIICEQSIEGIANGIEKLYKDRLLRNSLSKACKEVNHDNKDELKKLYKLF